MSTPDHDLAALGAQLEKRTQFEAACKQLAGSVPDPSFRGRALPLARRAHKLLKARHTSVGAWTAGLRLFEALAAGASDEEAAAAWEARAAEARAFLGEDDAAAAGEPETLADLVYGREAAAEMRRRRAAAAPVFTDAGLVEPPTAPRRAPAVAVAAATAAAAEGQEQEEDGAAAAAAAAAATGEGGLREARRLLMQQLQQAAAAMAAGGEDPDAASATTAGDGEGETQQQQQQQQQERLLAAMAAAMGGVGGVGGGDGGDEDDDDLQAALLASRLDEHAGPQAPARPPASRRVLAALPLRSVSRAEASAAAAGDASAAARCPICCESWREGDAVQALLPGCGHEFHRECLAPWLGRHSNQCPLCRAELPTDDHAFEAKKEREREEAEEREGAANAARGGEFIYV